MPIPLRVALHTTPTSPVRADLHLVPILDDSDYFLIEKPGLYRLQVDLWSNADAERLGVHTTPNVDGSPTRVERRLISLSHGLTIRPASDWDIRRVDREAEVDHLAGRPASGLRLADLA